MDGYVGAPGSVYGPRLPLSVLGYADGAGAERWLVMVDMLAMFPVGGSD
jgi:hypothetical protein